MTKKRQQHNNKKKQPKPQIKQTNNRLPETYFSMYDAIIEND